MKDLEVDGRIILKLVVKKEEGMTWTGLIWLRRVAESCERSNELQSFLKFGVFID